ncbi:MAG: hypothetical protein HY644_00175 [Acidobacteria bacterium]|nr:hypothetical protein [Acidobacteriota bacterium]
MQGQIRQLWDQTKDSVLVGRVREFLGRVADDPFLWGAVALAALLILWTMVLLFRRRPIESHGSQHAVEEDAKQKRNVRKSIEKTLQELQQEDPQFVNCMHSILKYRSLDQLLNQEEIEVAFGRLSYLQEKRRKAPRKRSSLLALSENSHDFIQRRAAMTTIVRSCYGSDEIYSALDDDGRRSVDRFIDGL